MHIDIPFTDALAHMPSYMKFKKEILKHKRRIGEDDEPVVLWTRCNAILQSKLPPKLKDLGSISTRCTLGELHIERVLCDSGVEINLMSFSIFKK